MLSSSRSTLPRPHPIFGWALLAAIPVIYIVVRVVAASRNIVFWDEFDSVLAFLLRLDSGVGWQEVITRLFQLDSEHRTVTSRLIVAAGYGLTGKVNFDVICAIGNLALCALCAILLAAVPSVERRVRLGVVLAFGLFHLESYEAFFWSGASIDHFMVLMFAGGAIAGVAHGGRSTLAGAGLFGLLGTFTLAHGCVIWPIGAVMLWRAGRRRELVPWGALAAATLLVYFYGFEIEAAHQVRDFSPVGLARLAQYWLALLGGPLTFGGRSVAPIFGLALLGLLGWLGWRGAGKRNPAVMAMAVFALASLALIAIGRLQVAGPQIQSRYLILGSLAWSLAIFLLIEHRTQTTRPFRVLAWSLPGLVAFNIAANVQSAHDTEAFLWSRDYPAVRFKQYGEEGHAGPFQLHPAKDRARTVLAQTAARGIYQLPRFCRPATVAESQPSPDMVTYVTDLTVNEATIGFEGWAMLPAQRSRRGQIHVVLKSEKSFLVYSTFAVARPDVAKAFKEPLWRYCGYNFVLKREHLPPENFQVGLLIEQGDHSELKMTEHWIRLKSATSSASSLATGQ
ncbi:MAG: hypothetical protein ABIQ12_14505 [Opitutaceae bacterium]